MSFIDFTNAISDLDGNVITNEHEEDEQDVASPEIEKKNSESVLAVYSHLSCDDCHECIMLEPFRSFIHINNISGVKKRIILCTDCLRVEYCPCTSCESEHNVYSFYTCENCGCRMPVCKIRYGRINDSLREKKCEACTTHY